MKTISRMLVVSALVAAVSPALATPDEEVRGIISAWMQAYSEGDHNKLSRLYSRHARLHGVDTADMIGQEAISEHYYFENWNTKLRSVNLNDIKCSLYDDATAVCFGGMEFVVTRRLGETLSQPSQFSAAFAYEYDAGKWLIQDHRVLRGITVAVNPATNLQADAVKPPPLIVPATAATTPVQ